MMEKLLNKIAWYSLLTLIMVVVICVGVYTKTDVKVDVPLGGSAGEPYNATTTPQGAVFVDSLIRTGQGTFGGLLVTLAGTNVYNIFDATTTNVNLRTGNKATSTIFMATIPASLAAGTYKFDTVFTDGLYLDFVSGTTGSSTILWR